MKLPGLKDFDFKEKRVLVRCDLDVPLKEGEVAENSRIKECLPTVEYLLEKKAFIILAGHLGRPQGKEVEELKMLPVAREISRLMKRSLAGYKKMKFFSFYDLGEDLLLLENLRFFKGEEENSPEFTEKLSSLAEIYINEAFAVSHRKHASVVGVPLVLPSASGFHFEKEVTSLSKTIENPKKPLVFIIGGAKPETKLSYVYEFAQKADWVLVGGLLPLQKEKDKENIIWASLNKNGTDIDESSIEEFKKIISEAKTLVFNGPMENTKSRVLRKGPERLPKQWQILWL
jgi:phosphoglycerate kinase